MVMECRGALDFSRMLLFATFFVAFVFCVGGLELALGPSKLSDPAVYQYMGSYEELTGDSWITRLHEVHNSFHVLLYRQDVLQKDLRVRTEKHYISKHGAAGGIRDEISKVAGDVVALKIRAVFPWVEFTRYLKDPVGLFSNLVIKRGSATWYVNLAQSAGLYGKVRTVLQAEDLEAALESISVAKTDSIMMLQTGFDCKGPVHTSMLVMKHGLKDAQRDMVVKTIADVLFQGRKGGVIFNRYLPSFFEIVTATKSASSAMSQLAVQIESVTGPNIVSILDSSLEYSNFWRSSYVRTDYEEAWIAANVPCADDEKSAKLAAKHAMPQMSEGFVVKYISDVQKSLEGMCIGADEKKGLPDGLLAGSLGQEGASRGALSLPRMLPKGASRGSSLNDTASREVVSKAASKAAKAASKAAPKEAASKSSSTKETRSQSFTVSLYATSSVPKKKQNGARTVSIKKQLPIDTDWHFSTRHDANGFVPNTSVYNRRADVQIKKVKRLIDKLYGKTQYDLIVHRSNIDLSSVFVDVLLTRQQETLTVSQLKKAFLLLVKDSV